MTTKRFRLRGLLLILLTALALALWAVFSFGLDRARFERSITRISGDPSRYVGQSFSVDTWGSVGVSSPYIVEKVDQAFLLFSKAFQVPGKTYFSGFGDMPTQETVWQFPGYFVRLYATSALECDAADVGVFRGTYEEFRGELLTAKAGADVRFSLIEYQSPKRFLYPDR